MERHLLAALTLALLPIAAACRKPSAPTTVLRLLSGPDERGWAREIVSQFEDDNPEIRVEMVEGPKDTASRRALYEESLRARDGAYDIVFMDAIWVPRFAAQGWLRPLDDRFPRKQQDLFLRGDMTVSTYKGRVYRVPFHSDAGLLFYRKDLLRRAGISPPKTFEELSAAAAKLQSPPQVWGFVYAGKGEGLVCCFLEALWGRGGSLLDGRGEVRLEDPPAVAALEWLSDLLHAKKVSPPEVLGFDEDDALRMFREGRAVFMRNWPYAYGLLQEDRSAVKGQVGFAPMPRARGRKGAAALGGWGYGIAASAPDPEAAWKFIEFATSPESQKIAYMRGGLVPTRKALFNDPDIIKGSPHYPELMEMLDEARLRPRHPAYPRVSEILQAHLTAALSRKQTPAKALARAAGEIRAAIQR